ncbi:MAG: hypothetical protein D6160_04220 [Ketobacter sp.]|nr:MAG: hypothetical protein D6160_04220 [Ketobacter sp.]
MKMTRITILILVALLAVSCSQPSAEDKWMQFVTQTVGKQYQDFADESSALAAAAGGYCGRDGNPESDLQLLQQQWLKTMSAWQTVQWVRFGPIVQNNEDWRIQFWPDKKNLVSRKTQQLLQKDEPITDAVIESASVVIQGLSELELLLFDEEYTPVYAADDPMAQRQCQLLEAVSNRLKKTTSQIAADWKDPAANEEWLNSIADQDEKQLASLRNGKIVDSILAQVERVKVDKLGGPLGFKNRSKQANGYFSESWRSGSSLENVKHNLAAIKALLAHPDEYDLSDYLIEHDQAELAQKLAASLDSILTQIEAVDADLKVAVTQPQSKAEIAKIYDQVNGLNQILREQLAPALGVVLGFNSNDGD